MLLIDGFTADVDCVKQTLVGAGVYALINSLIAVLSFHYT